MHNYHNNVIVSVKNHVYNNINTDLNITVNKPSTVLYKDNSLINTDILNTINENTSTIVNKNDTDLTIKDNNNELHKSNYTTVNKELNLELNSVVSTKYNGNTLIIDNHSTELYKNDSSITTENNEDIIIDNNYVSLQKKNTDDTINLNNNYLLKSNLIETYGTNHSNNTYHKHLKNTSTFIIDNDINETYKINKLSIDNSLISVIDGNKSKLINNNNNEDFELDRNIRINSDSIETVTGKINNNIYDNFIIEEHAGEIQINTK